MGFFDFVGSVIGGVCSAVASTLGAIGSVIGGLATKIAPFVDLAITAVRAIGEFCGLIRADDRIEDYGAAMRQAEKKPDDFDSINDYIDYLREEIKSGKIDLEAPTEADHLANKALGCALMIQGIDERYSLKSSPEFWMTMGKKIEQGKLDEKDMDSLLKSNRTVDVKEIGRYIEHEPLEGDISKKEVSDTIINALKESKPEMSEEELNKKFNELIKKD